MASDNPNELKVWVDGYQRCICGITDTTTVQEVVIALAQAVGQTGRYTLVEKWRSTERLLPPQECPLALLQKWGLYKKDIQFILRRSDKNASGQSQQSQQSASGQSGHSSNQNNLPPPYNNPTKNTRSLQHQGSLTGNQNYLSNTQQYNQNLVRRQNSNLGSNTLPNQIRSQPQQNNRSGSMSNYNRLPNSSGDNNQNFNHQQHTQQNSHNNSQNFNNMNQSNIQSNQNPNGNGDPNQIISKKHQENVNKIQQDMEQHARQEYNKTIRKQEQV